MRKKIENVTSNETVVIKERSEVLAFFEKQKNTDMWQKCYTNELVVKPLINNPIMLEATMQDSGIDIGGDEMEKAVTECMATHKICLQFPTTNRFVTYPFRDTAITSLGERLASTGKLIKSVCDRNNFTEMTPEEKAFEYTTHAKHFKDSSLVLVRNSAVSAVLSGDNRDYQIMPVHDLITALEDALVSQVEIFHLVEATCNYEFATVIYRLEDTAMQEKLNDTFANLTGGMAVTPYVKLITSDVGLCSATLFSYLEFDNGKQILLGRGLDTEHKGEKAMDKFVMNCERIYAYFLDCAERIAELQNIPIKHPRGCATSLAQESKFNKKATINTLGKLDSYTNTTAFDIYCSLFEVVDAMVYERKNENNPFSEKELIDLQYRISMLLPWDYRQNDMEYNWGD